MLGRNFILQYRTLFCEVTREMLCEHCSKHFLFKYTEKVKIRSIMLTLTYNLKYHVAHKHISNVENNVQHLWCVSPFLYILHGCKDSIFNPRVSKFVLLSNFKPIFRSLTFCLHPCFCSTKVDQ